MLGPGNCSRQVLRQAFNPPAHGLERQRRTSNNPGMKIKPTQIYDWDAEPVDERPSEFMACSGFSAASGFHATSTLTRPLPAKPQFGMTLLLAAAVGVLALGALAIAKLLPLLRG